VQECTERLQYRIPTVTLAAALQRAGKQSGGAQELGVTNHGT